MPDLEQVEILSVKADVASLKSDVVGLKIESRENHEDLQELKSDTKKLLEFMYRIEGGKAWLVAMWAVAGTVGAFLTSLLYYIFPKVH